MIDYPNGFDSDKHSNMPICGVLSLAIAAGVSFDVAHATCRSTMDSHRQRFRGGISLKQLERAMDKLATRYVKRTVVGSLTLRKFAEKYAKPDTVYIMRKRGHLFTFKNGVVCDQGRNCDWTEYKPRCIITHYYEITGKGW